MKATLSYKSKRNIIIASVIVVLLAAISTAGYFYIKGNDETARAFTQNEITNELTPGEQTQNNGGQQENQTQNPEQSTTPGDQNNNGGEQTPNSQTNNGQNQNNNTTNNGSTPDQTTGDVPNQEYVRERVEERTTITKEYSVEWTPETISANASVQNLNIIRPIISANKSADKNAVVSGEIITYTITVTNTGNADGKAIVKDTIPEATEFIENSIKINGENTNYTAQNLEEGITVDVAKQNEQGEAGTVKVEFKVKVSNIFAQYEKASIINQATVNEEETNEVKNPVIKFEKSANKEKVKVGDTVTYTISIENIGDAEGTATVKDTIPTGTKLVENSTIKLNGEDTEYTEQKLNDGIELTVKSGERLELTFEVEVLSEITEAVINTAYVNDIPTETIPTQVESLIKFESNGGTSVGSMNGYTGDVIENREMPTTTREGYTFDGWYAEPELTNKVETLPEKYPAGTTTYYAKWTANTDTKYTVEYYYQNRGDYAEPTKRVERNGTTDTLAQVSNEDKIPEQTGYVYDASAENVLEGTIAGDGSLVLKVYFKQQFTVTYKPGAQGTFTEQTKTGLDYGTATPEFECGPTGPTGKQGYTFAGWEPSVATEVTSNAEYVAQWTANTDTKYTVEYYYQNRGDYAEPIKRVERKGTTDTLAQVSNEDKIPEQTGYVYDATAENVLEGTIAGDGSLVLKVYFKQQFTVIYKPGTQGTFTEQTKTGLDYGTATPTFEGETTGEQGYTFAGWEPSVATEVTSNAEYVAQWTANTDTKYTVEYYYQNRGDYAEPIKRVERKGTTDTLAQVSNEDKIPEQTGYVYDASAENVLEGTIAGDGSLVLKVYFKQQFTVTYKPGTQGTFTKQTKTGLDYGTTTPTFEGKTTGKPGYTFAGWEPSVATEVTSNAEYVAQWTPNTDTKYTVKHYLQMLDKTQGYYLKETENNLTGTTGTLTNAQAKTYPGFTAQSFDQKEIAGDGSTVIEIYYNRNNYTYEIQYLYENKHGEYKINEGATKTGSAKPYGTIITEFPARDENGKYVLAYVEPAKSTTENKIANLVITEGDNVLKVYYKRNSFDYRIEYYKETSTGIEFIKTTKPKQRKLQTEITDEIVTADFEKGWKNAEKPNPKKVYENGIVENAESTNYYITIKESNNVIKVIYKRKDLDYTVEYYLNGTKKASYNDTAKYGDIISTLKNDNYSSNGWQKDERNSTKLPHTIEKSGDVIKIFYIKPDIKAKKTIWQDSKKLNDNAIVEAGSTVTYKITASNAGYLAGSVTIKDEELPQGKVKNITATGHTEKLTAKDLKDGIELNVPAQGAAEVTITIELTGAIGTQISNTAKYDNTKTNEVKNNVEKTLQLTTKSEIKKITNSNVILVLDISGSMKKPSNNDICTEHTTKKQHEDAGCDKVNGVWHKSRISVAKNVINNLIDNVQLPSIQTENSSVIEVIRFQFSPFVVGRATTTSDVNSLKTAVNNTNNIGGNTEMAKALNKAKAEIEELKTINNNENIVIFVSNGEPTDDKSGVIKAAEELQKLATVYTVGFDVDIDILKQIATDPEKYKTTDQAGSLSNIFKEITQEITGTPVKTVSQQGLVELTNVDTNKLNKTIVKIKGVAISNQKVIDAIVNKGKKYYIDLNKIGLTNLQDDILIEYFAK